MMELEHYLLLRKAETSHVNRLYACFPFSKVKILLIIMYICVYLKIDSALIQG